MTALNSERTALNSEIALTRHLDIETGLNSENSLFKPLNIQLNGENLMSQNSWPAFFYIWYNESRADIKSTETRFVDLLTKNDLLLKSNEALLKSNDLLLKKVDFLQVQVLSLQKKPKLKRTKRILRDTLNRAEFQGILDQDIKGRSPLSLSRKRLSLILLYITGLRVSNLLNLRVQDLKDEKRRSDT